MKPEEIIALYRLNMLSGESLPDFAIEWIESGFDSQALIELAGENSPALRDVAHLFEQGIKDMGLAIPSKKRALLLLANIYCKKILSGEMSPYEGAHNIWQRICIDDEAPEVTFGFITLADAIQNTGDQKARDHFSNLIVKEAEALVNEVNV